MTDKLVTYLNFRRTRYKGITFSISDSSNYYHVGDFVIRVSDHIKYGTTSQKSYDYCFVIQPNDTYLFFISPMSSATASSHMFVKIITLQEAKTFIKKLHDFTLYLKQMSAHYSPEGWNLTTSVSKNLVIKEIIPEEDDGIDDNEPATTIQLSWSDFYNKYIDGKPDTKKVNILDTIEIIYHQVQSKGKLKEKMEIIPAIYNQLTRKQYRKLIFKLNQKK